jgi:hypothetical protein
MKIVIRILFISLTVFFITNFQGYSYKKVQTKPQGGKVKFKCKTYNASNIEIPTEVNFLSNFEGWWYQDNNNNCYTIEEVKKRATRYENDVVVSDKRVLMYYLFTDIKAGMFYLYRKFSDTAPLLTYFDTSIRILPAGVARSFFFGENYRGDYKYTLKFMNDTVIENTHYRKYISQIWLNNERQNEDDTELFEMVGRRKTLFDFGYGVTNPVEHAISRVDMLAEDRSLGRLSWQITFVRDTLNAQEMKVFRAWIKNAKKHPVMNKRDTIFQHKLLRIL